jgi:hypothetical protein
MFTIVLAYLYLINGGLIIPTGVFFLSARRQWPNKRAILASIKFAMLFWWYMAFSVPVWLAGVFLYD